MFTYFKTTYSHARQSEPAARSRKAARVGVKPW